MKMGSGTTKKAERVERKKKKLNALLEITKLNDKDRIKEHSKLHVEEVQNSEIYVEEKEEGEIDDRLPSTVSDGPHCKRHKTNDGHVSYRHNGLPKESNKNSDSNKGSDKPFIIPTEELIKLRKELRERRNKLKAGNYTRYDYWSYRKPNTYFPFPRKHGMRPCTYNVLPRLLLNEMGEKGLLTRDYRTPLFITDIQHLIMFSQLANLTPVQPRWCSFEKVSKLSHTVLLVVEGPTVYDYLSAESSYPFLAGMNHRVEIVSPTSYDGNLVEELATVPLSRSQKDRLEKKYGSLRQAELNSGLVFRILRSIFPIELPPCRPNDNKTLPGGNRFSRTELLLSAWQMIEEGYPIPVKGELKDRYADYVMTKERYAAVTPSSPMWGLDCEMCFTSIRKNELTRVSIVDEDHKVVYESLVKPRNRIIDYLTQFSGITKAIMKDVTKTLEDVQQELRQLLPADVILVGQSLNFDLHALKLMHPYVIDTSVIYNISGVRPRKTKLSILAERFLGELIQTGHGHDSVEDSSSSLKLVQLKLANSVEFGDAVLSGQTEMYNPCNKPVPLSIAVAQSKPISQSIPVSQSKANSMNNSVFATSLFSHVTKNNKTAVVVGKEKVLSEYRPLAMIPSLNESCNSETRVKCESIENNNDAIAYACVEAQYQSFLLAHLQLDNNESLSDVNVWCNQLYESLATNAFFVTILAGRPYSKAHGACFVQIKGPNYNVSKQETCSRYNDSA